MSKLLHQPTSLKIKTKAKQEEQPPPPPLYNALFYPTCQPMFPILEPLPQIAQGSDMSKTVCAGWLANSSVTCFNSSFPFLTDARFQKNTEITTSDKKYRRKNTRPKVFHLNMGWGLDGAGCLHVLTAERYTPRNSKAKVISIKVMHSIRHKDLFCLPQSAVKAMKSTRQSVNRKA